MPKGKCKLCRTYLKDDRFKLWLQPVDGDQYKGHCTLCASDFSTEYGCESSLKSHARGESHKRLEKEKKDASKSLAPLFFSGLKKKENTASKALVSTALTTPTSEEPSTSSSSSNTKKGLIDDIVKRSLSTLHAEIRWSLKVVRSHFSFRSCDGLNDLFPCIFEDSLIAKDFKLSRTKCSYLVRFGLTPYFRDVLTNEIKSSPYFSVSFDESLNQSLQKNQMDVQIRYWCPVSNLVKVRYWGSTFQYGASADVLVPALNDVLKNLDLSKMVQLAMDGPNVNWLILSMIQKEREEEEYSPLEEIGSCGLHVVSGAFQNGVKAAAWDLEKVLRALWKLLDKSPARRGEYIKVCTVSPPVFPLKFCATRWTENEPVASRAIDVWESFVQLIKDFLLKPPSKRPQNNSSFDTLAIAHKDPLMPVKLHIFRDIAAMLNVFLTKFQSNAPLVPFLADNVESIMRRFMKYILLKKVVDEANNQYKLIEIDVSDASKHKPISAVKLPTGSEALLYSGSFTDAQKVAIKKGFVALLKTIIAKIQEKSPLKFLLVRAAASLSPFNMADKQKKCFSCFSKLINRLHKDKYLCGVESDAAKEQYETFMETDVKQNINLFRKFDINKRLDEFLGSFMVGVPKYKDLWKVCIFIFIMTHGQAPVERGFNVNKETEVENLQEEALVALRFVFDEILSRGDDIKKIDIAPELSLSCQMAHKRYDEYLESKRRAVQMDAIGSKRKLLQEEHAEVKRKKKEEEEIIVSLESSVNSYISQATKEEDHSKLKGIITKMNSFKETIGKKMIILDMEKALLKLDSEIVQCK